MLQRLAIFFLIAHAVDSVVTNRKLFVIENRVAKVQLEQAFGLVDSKLQVSTRPTGANEFGPWADLGSPTVAKTIVSNPVAVHDVNNQTEVFVQVSNGQVYSILQDKSDPSKFSKWSEISSNKLPVDYKSTVSVKEIDSLFSLARNTEIHVFARSLTSNSSLFVCKISSKPCAWQLIGGNKSNLATAAEVIYNPFSNYFEAFAVMQDGYLYRTWQKKVDEWASWRTMSIDPPKMSMSKPVAAVMSHDWANGVIEVYGKGQDGRIHHIFQTTCDHVDNPWGYCTWGVWHSMNGKVPVSGVSNPLTTGHNIHYGVEIFTIDSSGSLWHVWQLQRGDSWSDWEQIQTSPVAVSLTSVPFVNNDKQGWWQAFGFIDNDKIAVVTQSRKIAAQPSDVAFGTPLNVAWSVPTDEATNKDWIGVYPAGSTDGQYVDYRYIQGGLNPITDRIPVGNVSMTSFLPDGYYDIRYLVNRQYLNVMSTKVSYFNMSHEEAWVQLYRGLFYGLGSKNVNFDKCVEEGNATVAKFEESFEAFEDREIFKGLQLLGVALDDVRKTLMVCEETAIAKALEKFINDLVKCTEQNCENFIIDILEFLMILYEDVYEIFGDIHAASNNFNLIKGYEQGGLCIGRLVKACISLPN
ncbi:uncharacterized protein LOC117102599 isoform X2 [Anneissia japonica]|uniref:uncharacterized protein LOC117102599 isoform X2 n=2 Tax=Anneissia japonica TaxID=1529436 RepID=UPI00142565BB|nr:uncharacterized protein LOC117102599 isoform X2 [Anneissia japonica]